MKWKGRMGSHLRLFNAFLRLVTGVLGANKAELHPLFIYRHKDRKIQFAMICDCLQIYFCFIRKRDSIDSGILE